MGAIKDGHKAYRDANLTLFQKRHRHLRFALTSAKDRGRANKGTRY